MNKYCYKIPQQEEEKSTIRLSYLCRFKVDSNFPDFNKFTSEEFNIHIWSLNNMETDIFFSKKKIYRSVVKLSEGDGLAVECKDLRAIITYTTRRVIEMPRARV